MTSENIYNKDGTRRSCPHGASVDYPVGTIHHVKVGDRNCVKCPCFDSFGRFDTVMCHYPKFAPHYGIDDN